MVHGHKSFPWVGGLVAMAISRFNLSPSLCVMFPDRFRDEEFDDRMMESSFAQQQFEEMRR